MSPSEFVEAIRKVISQGTSRAITKIMIDPSDRRPDPELPELCTWYGALPHGDQANLHKIIRRTSDMVAFEILCVLDGVMAIEGKGEKGHLELTYVNGDHRRLLNAPASALLHDLYNEEKT